MDAISQGSAPLHQSVDADLNGADCHDSAVFGDFFARFGGLRPDINGVPFINFLAPGLIMMSIVQNAFANSSSSLLVAKVQGNVVDFLMPPLSPLS